MTNDCYIYQVTNLYQNINRIFHQETEY